MHENDSINHILKEAFLQIDSTLDTGTGHLNTRTKIDREEEISE